ncbi:nickel pincer cofactor biosynthesis protein LarC [Actinoplanes sp. NPDC020271]|uniref:nickel pincer cofactor biosynthesis protein LarC n=1 Tax=Actinoplanes sp. NPDC020271 TaxID=3363896 RepID=UPI003795538F
MTHLWIDASAGIAGDMLLGALLDAGADLARVQNAVDAVLPGAVRITTTEVRRAGLRAHKADVTPLAADQPHRTWRDIRGLLGDAPRAAEVFARLAAAEAAVHGVTPDEVHFHEVGALDAIADVTGVCAALDDLGVTTVSASEVAVGSGAVRAAHGILPVPAPAVAELARGWRIRSGGTGELATPTGMALLRTLAATCEDLPSLTVSAIGVGAGTRDTPGRPNIVRVLIGTAAAKPDRAALREPSIQETMTQGTTAQAATTQAATAQGATAQGATAQNATVHEDAARTAMAQEAIVLEANVDDLDPRLWPGVISALLAAGADDAWLTPILMKKGRPAHTVTALCAPASAHAVRDRIFQETSTLGVRSSRRSKAALARTFVRVEVAGHPVAIKLGHAAGRIVQAMPEFDDVAALAAALGITQREALARAAQAAAAAGLTLGATPPPS